jgi:hypothetical protein
MLAGVCSNVLALDQKRMYNYVQGCRPSHN